ncbi:ParB/RepB/Spo0J family partition protein [Bradyrhizobium symbiodeficiens]|uniref:ParB/RepB/Spo0J family partition protein n=1 Tax=Bradyrhizobium symbiodeficiens TaxID=1404367 RepID=UPI000BA1BBBF|nr:ParB N-terminal domain-containing protein [Bradyrhizobium symbiodeficiens]AWM06074.1 hypothetical protein CIT39_06145 [Bradyrhizobium symbiodeficiens]
MSDVRTPIMIPLADIKLVRTTRPLNEKYATQLVASIRNHGIQHPIHVYELNQGGYGVAAGHHRYRAYEKLKLTSIPAVVLPRAEARAWKWVENNDRYNIDPLTESIGIVESARATETLSGLAIVTPVGGKQPHDKGISKLAKATGRNRKRVKAAFGHHGLSSQVKARIYKHPDLNKRAILDRLVSMVTEADQLQYLDDLDRKHDGPDGPKKSRSKMHWGLSYEVRLVKLRRAYNASSFKSDFERQPEAVRKRFIRDCLR